MRVDSLEAIPYSLPFREPYVTSRGRLTERDLLLVRAKADGLEGWGETAALSLRGGAGVRELAAEVEGVCRDTLLEGGFEPERIWSALAVCRSRGAGAPALAAVDIALHDLAGKAAGKPLWEMLGAVAASPVVCNATLPAANPTALRELAERWAADGFRTFKLKMGLASDMAQIATVRSVLGAEVRIRIDANAAWSVSDAVDRLREIGRHDIELAEEPVAGLEQLAAVRAQTRIPIAADESVSGQRDARRAVELDACSLATVKLAKVGGIAEALEIASIMPVYMSSALEGPIGIAAAAHCVQALPSQPATAGLAHGLATERLFSETVGRGAEASRDTLRLGDEPGLGVEIDLDALEARRLS
jgi:L-alanine-DL-glutamate epimerase-like enolase superfamily enzyme